MLTLAAAEQFSDITSRAWTSHAFDRADFGAMHLVAESSGSVPAPAGCFLRLGAALAALAANGSAGCAPGADAQPPARVDEGVLAAVSWALAVPASGSAATARLTYFADEVVGLVTGQSGINPVEIIPPYWRRNLTRALDSNATYQLPVAEVAAAVAAAPAALAAAAALDDRIAALFQRAGGQQYAALGALAYRQVYGAMGAMWFSGHNSIWNTSRPMYFLKETSSDGALSTVDVIFPATPQLLYQSPTLFRQLLEPILSFTANLSCTPVHSPSCNVYTEP